MSSAISEAIVGLLVSRVANLKTNFAIISISSKEEIFFKINPIRISECLKETSQKYLVTQTLPRLCPQLFDFLENVRRNEVNAMMRVCLETVVNEQFCKATGRIELIGGEKFKLHKSTPINSIDLKNKVIHYDLFNF